MMIQKTMTMMIWRKIYLDKKECIGQRFGKLVITGIAPTPLHIKNRSTVYVYCDCDCGTKNVVKNYGNLKYCGVYSCGCEYHKIGRRYKQNKYIEKENMIVMFDNKDNEFYISKCDLDKVLQYTWYVNKSRDNEVCNAANSIKLHRYIMDIHNGDPAILVDHINHNKNDNRRENLRIVNTPQNSMNKGLTKRNTSGVAGVSYDKRDKRWDAYINWNYKKISLGSFADFNDAVKARKDAEEKYFGEFSYDNSQKIAQQYMKG